MLVLYLQGSRKRYLQLPLQCNPRFLHYSQFGFRQLKSCIVEIICFLAKIYITNDTKVHEELNVFYIDFEKAFDKVPHDIEIIKLKLLAIRGKALMIITDYLDNRRQIFRVGDCLSSERDSTSGVQQGSVLGPLHFFSTSPTF